MGRFTITLTDRGKCDVTMTLFDKNHSILGQLSYTFDVKPTVKELLDRAKGCKHSGAKYVRLTTQPSCSSKMYRI